jgi:hypothetical protein
VVKAMSPSNRKHQRGDAVPVPGARAVSGASGAGGAGGRAMRIILGRLPLGRHRLRPAYSTPARLRACCGRISLSTSLRSGLSGLSKN